MVPDIRQHATADYVRKLLVDYRIKTRVEFTDNYIRRALHQIARLYFTFGWRIFPWSLRTATRINNGATCPNERRDFFRCIETCLQTSDCKGTNALVA